MRAPLDPARRLLEPGQSDRQPGVGSRVPRRAAARRGWVRPGLPGAADRPRRSTARRSSASRSASTSTPGCARPTSGSSWKGTRGPSASSTSSRSLRAGRPVLYCLALEYAPHGDLQAFLHRTGKGWPERTARREIAGILEVLRQAAPRPDAPPRPHPHERVRVRGPLPQARRLRDRPAAERRTGDHRAHAERPDRAQRDPGRRRSEVAGPRRRVPGRAAPGNAGQGRRARARLDRRDPPPALQRSPQGDRLPLPRRAAEALRERGRADRGACGIRPRR